jgi:DNA mismatch repair ATPase MutL
MKHKDPTSHPDPQIEALLKAAMADAPTQDSGKESHAPAQSKKKEDKDEATEEHNDKTEQRKDNRKENPKEDKKEDKKENKKENKKEKKRKKNNDNANNDSNNDTDDEREEGKSLADVIRERANEVERRPLGSLTLKSIVGGDILATTAVRKQIGVIMLIVLFMLVYISDRYSCQQSLIQIDKLNEELNDAKAKALSSSSKLTEKSRESRVLEMLQACKDSTLHISTQPPYIINIPEQ